MRESDDGTQRREVNFDGAAILRISVRGHRLIRAFDAAFNVLLRLFIEREDAVFRTRFNRHVGNRQTIRHRQCGDSFAREFQ